MVRKSLDIWLALLLLAAPEAASSAPAKTAPPKPDLAVIREWNKIGRIADAEKAARALLIATESERGADAFEVAEVLDQLAIALRRGGKGREPEALNVCERALSIKGKTVGEDDSSYAISLRNLGMLYSARGDAQQALPILERALRIQERSLGPKHAEVAMTLSTIAASQAGLGRDGDAATTMERAVAIQRAALPADDPDRSIGLTGLAAIRFRLGDLSEAASLGEEAVAVLRRSGAPDSPMLGNSYHNLGSVYTELGDFDSARRVYEEALRIRGRDPGRAIQAAQTATDLGYVLYCLRNLRQARSRYLSAIETLEREGAGESSDAGLARAKLGLCYLELGELNPAKRELQEALRIHESSAGSGSWEVWMTLLGLARVAAREGDFGGAREFYERDIRTVQAEFGDSHPDLANLLAEYGVFLLAAGDSAAAFDISIRAAHINAEYMRRTARGISERQGLVYGAIRPDGLDATLAILAGGSRDGRVAETWNAVIRKRTLVLDEMTTRNRVASSDSALAGLLEDLERARRRLSNLSVRGPNGEDIDRFRASMSRQREEVERLESSLGSRSAAFATERAQSRIGIEEVKRALSKSSALIGLASYGSKASRAYLAFVGTDAGHVRAVPLGSATATDSLVLAWRKALARPPRENSAASKKEGEATCRRVGAALRQRILDPLEPYLRGVSRVYIVPEGPLHLINWAALPTRDGGYLIESPPVVHLLSSERDLATEAGEAPRGVGLLACGDPQFDAALHAGQPGTKNSASRRATPPQAAATPRGGTIDCSDFRSVRFAPLPGAAKEVGEIAAEWQDPTTALVLKGAGATEGAVKQQATGRRVVHLATHGFFLDGTCLDGGASAVETRGIGGISPSSKPTRRSRAGPEALRLSGLALAGANRRSDVKVDEEDGILTAEEISSLNLTGVDWAVLSACDTGLGTIQPGEGVLGLRRSFQVAGARTVIMSLWQVDDESTRDWMMRLYKNRFRRGLGTAEAVREASLGLLNDRKAQGRSTHPFYWAGFVAIGGWN